MINVGDTVKVISATKYNDNYVELYPIGTICRVMEKDSSGFFGILPVETPDCSPFFYLEDELEKGHLEWVRE